MEHADEGPDVIARRLEQFRETGDPRALWPRLIEPARVAASRELERITRAVLAGRGAEIDPEAAHEAYALGIAGFTSGMGPIVGLWLERGTVSTRADVRRAFGRHLDSARVRAARIEQDVLPAIDALIEHGITPVFLKGFHTSRRYFDEPAARSMADVDLLVPVDRVADAESALRAAGFRANGPASIPYKRDWISHHVDPRVFSIEVTDARSKWTVEVHTSLDRQFHPGAVARLDALLSHVEPLDVAGRRTLGLAPEALIVALACHCSQELDGVRLMRLFEIVQVVRARQVDWRMVLDLVDQTAAARFTFPALAMVESLAPGTVDARVIARGRAESTWAARHTVDRMVPAGGSLDERGVLRQAMWTRGFVAVGQRVLRTAWPASFVRPSDVPTGWKVRIARMRRGVLSFWAPDERAGR